MVCVRVVAGVGVVLIVTVVVTLRIVSSEDFMTVLSVVATLGALSPLVGKDVIVGGRHSAPIGEGRRHRGAIA